MVLEIAGYSAQNEISHDQCFHSVLSEDTTEECCQAERHWITRSIPTNKSKYNLGPVSDLLMIVYRRGVYSSVTRSCNQMQEVKGILLYAERMKSLRPCSHLARCKSAMIPNPHFLAY